MRLSQAAGAMIQGECDARFARVREEFARGFGELASDPERGEIGAAVAASVGGRLVGELIRRATGLTLGRHMREELAGPLGLDLHLGLDAAHDARTADLTPLPPGAPGSEQGALIARIRADRESVTAKAFTNPPTLLAPDVVNTRAWRAAEIPAANAHATARSLAALYGALVAPRSGTRLLGSELLASCSAEESRGFDEVLRLPTRFGPGFMLSQPHARFGPGPRAFGHPGGGGSLGFADPDAGIGFGYVANRLGPYVLIDPRPAALADALYACL